MARRRPVCGATPVPRCPEGANASKAREKGIELLGPNGLLTTLTSRMLEATLEAEMTKHLGYGKHDPAGRNHGNSGNGVRTDRPRTDLECGHFLAGLCNGSPENLQQQSAATKAQPGGGGCDYSRLARRKRRSMRRAPPLCKQGVRWFGMKSWKAVIRNRTWDARRATVGPHVAAISGQRRSLRVSAIGVCSTVHAGLSTASEN
jgi:hypothetical protein